MYDKVKELFTYEAEVLNGRVCMCAFVLTVVTELLTGVGPVGQVLSLFGVSF